MRRWSSPFSRDSFTHQKSNKCWEISMSKIRVIASDLEFPEGPVAMPDGSVVLVEIRRQTLTRVYPDGRKEIVAKIPGGPNGAALGPDGKMYLCNNGGFSWASGPAGVVIPQGQAAE
jgi:gluconolactonase